MGDGFYRSKDPTNSIEGQMSFKVTVNHCYVKHRLLTTQVASLKVIGRRGLR